MCMPAHNATHVEQFNYLGSMLWYRHEIGWCKFVCDSICLNMFNVIAKAPREMCQQQLHSQINFIVLIQCELAEFHKVQQQVKRLKLMHESQASEKSEMTDVSKLVEVSDEFKKRPGKRHLLF